MTVLCVDTSAWHRSTNPKVQARFRAALEADELGICDQVRLEILYSARSAADYAALEEELAGLLPISMGSETFSRALKVQRALADRGGLLHRSVKIADLLIAAAAEQAKAAIWHYDANFDRIAGITGQPSEWIAPRGSL
ncbi:MAG: PIN domain-containing protein [Actinomycetota bacterium]